MNTIEKIKNDKETIIKGINDIVFDGLNVVNNIELLESTNLGLDEIGLGTPLTVGLDEETTPFLLVHYYGLFDKDGNENDEFMLAVTEVNDEIRVMLFNLEDPDSNFSIE